MTKRADKQKQNLPGGGHSFRGKTTLEVIGCGVEKAVAKFRDFREAEKADREFYRKLSGQERLNILLQLCKQEPERRLERVSRIIKLPRS